MQLILGRSSLRQAQTDKDRVTLSTEFTEVSKGDFIA